MPIWLKIAGQLLGNKVISNSQSAGIIKQGLGLINSARGGLK